MAEHFETEDLERALARHIPDSLSFSPIPTGKHNTSYFVSQDGGDEFVLRIAPPDDAGFLFYERGMMAQEPEVHGIVRERTSVPVAEIVAYDTTRAVLPRDFILMKRLPGDALSGTSLNARARSRLFEQVGAALAQIHSITRDKFGYLGAHHCMQPQATWPDAFHVMWNKLLDDITGCGGYSEEEVAVLRKLLDDSRKAFDHSPPSGLLHMDVWAQNILCDSRGNLTGLVDFDRAVWGDTEIEFAVLDYCGVSVEAFWQGYGSERDGSREAQVRGLFYYLYELQKYIVIEILRRSNPTRAAAYKRETFRLLRTSVR